MDRMTDEQARAFLEHGSRPATFASVRPDGRPHAVPTWYAISGSDIVFTTWHTTVKAANLRRDPRASVLVDHYDDDWSRLWWVRLDGTARIFEQGTEFERALALLAHKYAQYAAEPPRGPVIAMLVRGWRGWRAAQLKTEIGRW